MTDRANAHVGIRKIPPAGTACTDDANLPLLPRRPPCLHHRRQLLPHGCAHPLATSTMSSRPIPDFPADEPSTWVPAVVPRRNAQVGDDSYLQLNIALRGNFNVNASC